VGEEGVVLLGEGVTMVTRPTPQPPNPANTPLILIPLDVSLTPLIF
jgi:hypothetical protein